VPPPRTTIPPLDAAAFECTRGLDDVRTALIVVNVHAMARAPTARDFDYVARAGAYVWVAAALEQFVRQFLEGLISEINAAAIPRDALRESLLALDNARAFQAMHSLEHPRDLRKWSYQRAVLESVASSQVAVLSLQQEHWPLDGSTLKRQQLEAIWDVFGLEPPVLPSSRSYGFLTDLRENRNRAAHGEEDPVRLGRQQSAQDALDLVRRAEEIVLHMLDRGTSYVLGRKYRR
jgi:hypothetical protein